MERLDKKGTATREAVEALQSAIERGMDLPPLPNEAALRMALATWIGDYGSWSPNSRPVKTLTAFLRDWFGREQA